MVELLRSHGAIPERVPTIAVEPPRTPAQMERAVKGLVDGRYQWVVFTSINSVRAVWEKFTEFGLDARAFAGVKIACVDNATGDAVKALGINPELVSGHPEFSVGLLDDFPEFDDILDPVDRVLLPRADIATETLAEGLRERGWEIDTSRPIGRSGPHRRRQPSGRRSRRAASTLCASVVVDSSQPGRHCRQATRALDRGVSGSQDGRDGTGVRTSGRRPAGSPDIAALVETLSATRPGCVRRVHCRRRASPRAAGRSSVVPAVARRWASPLLCWKDLGCVTFKTIPNWPVS